MLSGNKEIKFKMAVYEVLKLEKYAIKDGVFLYICCIDKFSKCSCKQKENMYLRSNDTFKLTILFSEQVQIQVNIFKGVR